MSLLLITWLDTFWTHLIIYHKRITPNEPPKFIRIILLRIIFNTEKLQVKCSTIRKCVCNVLSDRWFARKPLKIMLINVATRKCICYDFTWKSVQNCIGTDYNYVKYTAVIISCKCVRNSFFTDKGTEINILGFLAHIVSVTTT